MSKYAYLLSLAVISSTAATAADLPAKKAAPAASPASVSAACPAFGAGYFSIPGSETCIKISGYVRSDNKYTANVTRPGTAPYGFGYKAVLGFNAMSNTELGTINGRLGFYVADSAPSSASALTESAYVQIAGLTAGYAPSMMDFSNAYNNSGPSYQNTVSTIYYSAPMATGTTVNFGAQTAESDNGTTSNVYDTTQVASRPDLMATVATKLGDHSIKLGAVSHEISLTGATAQGFAVLGRADVVFDPAKIIINFGYANGANNYVDNQTYAGNNALGTSLKDSASDGSSLSTASYLGAASEVKVGKDVAYGYMTSTTGSQDTTSYKMVRTGLGYRMNLATNLYVRPEIYRTYENKNGASGDTITDVFYLRIRRDF